MDAAEIKILRERLHSSSVKVEKLCERVAALRCELLTLDKQRNVRGGARVERVRKAAAKWLLQLSGLMTTWQSSGVAK